MDRSVLSLVLVSALTVLLAGVHVECKARVCYFGPPPEPDPDNPDNWMEQVMQKIGKRCSGKRQPTPAVTGKPTPAGTGKPTPGTKKPTPAVTEKPTQTSTEKPTPDGTGKPTLAGTWESTPAGTGTTTPTPECPSPAPLGMEDGTIPDNRITASSTYASYHAWEGRLNNAKAWTSTGTDANPWIEVELVDSTVVTGIITQGDSIGWYVKQFQVAYQKLPSSYYEHITDGNGNIKVFVGNTDDRTPFTNLFKESVVATVVRIEPTDWKSNYAALRLELIGCRRD
ncbi:lactadherin-like [Patiria miniata]|uniref:F5/8 type C domain-containing protein n=1 Tax=Patiria miniata TaxID=46514 RepID=A0A913Z0Q0_PATMI|nr:lactadherin-like [Patiria miniata]